VPENSKKVRHIFVANPKMSREAWIAQLRETVPSSFGSQLASVLQRLSLLLDCGNVIGSESELAHDRPFTCVSTAFFKGELLLSANKQQKVTPESEGVQDLLKQVVSGDDQKSKARREMAQSLLTKHLNQNDFIVSAAELYPDNPKMKKDNKFTTFMIGLSNLRAKTELSMRFNQLRWLLRKMKTMMSAEVIKEINRNIEGSEDKPTAYLLKWWDVFNQLLKKGHNEDCDSKSDKYSLEREMFQSFFGLEKGQYYKVVAKPETHKDESKLKKDEFKPNVYSNMIAKLWTRLCDIMSDVVDSNCQEPEIDLLKQIIHAQSSHKGLRFFPSYQSMDEKSSVHCELIIDHFIEEEEKKATAENKDKPGQTGTVYNMPSLPRCPTCHLHLCRHELRKHSATQNEDANPTHGHVDGARITSNGTHGMFVAHTQDVLFTDETRCYHWGQDNISLAFAVLSEIKKMVDPGSHDDIISLGRVCVRPSPLSSKEIEETIIAGEGPDQNEINKPPVISYELKLAIANACDSPQYEFLNALMSNLIA
jgi:hypothetical protein